MDGSIQKGGREGGRTYLIEVHQEHLPRFEAGLGADDGVGQLREHPHFGREEDAVVVRDVITRRPQAVAVEGGADVLPCKGGREGGRMIRNQVLVYRSYLSPDPPSFPPSLSPSLPPSLRTIRESNHGRPIPRLHDAGIILIKGLLAVGEILQEGGSEGGRGKREVHFDI